MSAENQERLAEWLRATPGAATVNCLRGAFRCTERERLEDELARLRAALASAEVTP